MRDGRSGEVTHSRMQIVSRCLGREPPNSISGGRGVVGDPDTRLLDVSGCSVDTEPKRTKTTSATDNENPANQMDEDSSRRGPATSHQLEPVDDENVSKKARVARNVLHIRGEDNVKFDVNEEAWPNADLVIRARYEGALMDGLSANKVKAGDEICSCTPRSRRLTFLPTNRSCSQVVSTNEGE